jgi:hypothetical protein
MAVANKQARARIDREVHLVLDQMLPQLEYEQVVGLLGSLRRLSSWPDIVLRAFSFASDVIELAPDADGAALSNPLVLAGGGHGQLLSEAEAARRLDAATQDVDPGAWAGSELLGPQELLGRLGVSRSTLHNWRRQQRVVALRKGLRNHVYPVRQFDGNAPIEGLADVLAASEGPEAAWAYLVTPNLALGGEAPLELLRHGEVERVKRAIDSELDYV